MNLDVEPGGSLFSFEVAKYPDGIALGDVYGLTFILEEIATHRFRQDIQHGGPEYDDTHTPRDWEDLIHRHSAYLTDAGGARSDYRDRLIKIAAIAVAAVQSWNRLNMVVLENLTQGQVSVETALVILDEAKAIIQNQTPFTVDFRRLHPDSKSQEGGAA
jgi:hypothetical protein